MNRRVFIISFCLLLASSLLLSAKFPAPKNLKLVGPVINLVSEMYIQPIDREKFIVVALKKTLQSLDKYCDFYTPDEFKSTLVETGHTFVGIGVELIKEEQKLLISKVEDLSPAMDAGLKKKDQLVAIDKQTTEGLNAIQALEKLSGKVGSTVQISILRGAKQYELTLKRQEQQKQSLLNATMFDQKQAYLRISSFQMASHKELSTLLSQWEKQDIEKLIIDLRGNTGGVLEAALLCADYFLEKDKILVHNRTRNPKDNISYRTSQRIAWQNKQLVLLIDKKTASSAEIFAGALKDHKRATILGTQSFGKGSMQKIFSLDDGYALRLTVGQFFTPNNLVIENTGITPDVQVSLELKAENIYKLETSPSFGKFKRQNSKDLKDTWLKLALSL